MFDRETGTLWSHLTGEALDGPLVGNHLEQVLSEQTTWGRWRAEHRQTLMLDVDPSDVRFDPYQTYYGAPDPGIGGGQKADDPPPVKAQERGGRVHGEGAGYTVTAPARDSLVE